MFVSFCLTFIYRANVDCVQNHKFLYTQMIQFKSNPIISGISTAENFNANISKTQVPQSFQGILKIQINLMIIC